MYVQLSGEKSLLVIECAFSMAILRKISLVYLALVILLSKQFKYSTFHAIFDMSLPVHREGCLEILVTFINISYCDIQYNCI